MNKKEENFNNEPYDKRRSFVGTLRTPVPPTRNQHQRSPIQNQTLNSNNRNNPPKTIKNTPKTSNQTYTGPISIGLLAVLLVTAGVFTFKHIKNYKDYMNKTYTKDIQTQIEKTMQTNDRRELYKVLSSTNTDSKLNKYFENPSNESEDEINSRDVASLNFNLVKASLADTLNCTIDDIKITYTNTQLNISTPNGSVSHWAKNGKSNDTGIPSNIAREIRAIAEAYQAVKEGSPLDKERLFESHKHLKTILGQFDYTINDGTLCLQGVENGKTYRFRTNAFSKKPKFYEFNNER